MRYGPDHKFWIVVDPKSSSTLGDILFQASLRDIDLQFKGGLTIDENPTLFTGKEEAETEALLRLVAIRASEAIARNAVGSDLRNVGRIELRSADGAIIFKANLHC